jgi:hypothetical protein
VLILFPVSFIAGSLILNIHFLIFLIFGFIYLSKKKPEIKFNLILFMFFSLCLVLMISTVFNEANITKSVLYFRFFAFCLISYYLFKEKLFNIEKTFFYFSIFVSIISIDLIFQYLFDFNIVGIKINEAGPTSLFLDEKVAGSFIQNFGFFLVFIIFNKIKKNNLKSVVVKSFLLSLISIAIFVSFQRVPMMIWLLFLISYGLIYYKTRLISVLISLVIFTLFIDNFGSKQILNNYRSFYINIMQIVDKTERNYLMVKDKNYSNRILGNKAEVIQFVTGSGHANIYANSIVIWTQNKFLGIGQKNFYNKCAENKFHRCSTHPHNYYLDILVSTGIIGFMFFIIFLLFFFIRIFYSIKKYSNKKDSLKFDILFISIINFLMFFFPLKSAGSFFTTNNSTYMIIILTILLSQLQTINSKNKFLKIL